MLTVHKDSLATGFKQFSVALKTGLVISAVFSMVPGAAPSETLGLDRIPEKNPRESRGFSDIRYASDQAN
jgi:hypothetical protein